MKYFLAALLLLAPLAAAVTPVFYAADGYYAFFEDTAMVSCVLADVNADDNTITLSFDTLLDNEIGLSVAEYCTRVGGAAWSVPYERVAWLRRDVSDFLYNPLQAPVIDNLALFSVLATNDRAKDPSLPPFGESSFRIQSSIVGDYLATYNSHVQYDAGRTQGFFKDEAPFVYALATDQVVSGTFAYADGSFLDESDYTAAGVLAPAKALSQPGLLASNGRVCGGFRCFTSSSADVDGKNLATDFFTTPLDLNYYSLPYYVRETRVTVTSYINSTVLQTQSFSVSPSSDRVAVPGSDIRVNQLLWHPTQADYIGTLSQTVLQGNSTTDWTTARIQVRTYLERNPWYRHQSVFDSTWTLRNLSTSTEWSSSVLDSTDTLWFEASLVVNNSAPPSPGFTADNYTVDAPSPIAANASGDSSDDSSNSSGSSGALDPDWSRDAAAGGGLSAQYATALELERARSRDSFFEVLVDLEALVVEFYVVVYSLAALVLCVAVFFFSLPYAFRKTRDELYKLGGLR